MTIKELKQIISERNLTDDMEVSICIETPCGFMCPDGAVCDVSSIRHGRDWHNNELLIVPKYHLRIANDDEVRKWQYRK